MRIPRALLTQIHAHLEAGYPNEACGVLLGKDSVVAEVIPASNTRTDSARNRYLIDPLAYLKIERDADRRGVPVLGIYHSHPDVAARPSAFDLDHAWPELSYLIVSVRMRKGWRKLLVWFRILKEAKAGETNSWRLREDRSQFDQETVEVLE